MKKMTVIAVFFLTVSALTLSAYAMGGGTIGGMSGSMGGSGVMRNFGFGLLDWFQKWRNGSDYARRPGQERKQMVELDQQHYEDSGYLKYQIQMKEKGLDALLKKTDPDIEKVRAIRSDIRELRLLADQEQRNYEIEAGKINPGYRSGSSDGRGSYGSSSRRGRGDTGYGGGMGGMAKADKELN
jgi:hypothetical protein